jgi:hypothetical protein
MMVEPHHKGGETFYGTSFREDFVTGGSDYYSETIAWSVSVTVSESDANVGGVSDSASSDSGSAPPPVDSSLAGSPASVEQNPIPAGVQITVGEAEFVINYYFGGSYHVGILSYVTMTVVTGEGVPIGGRISYVVESVISSKWSTKTVQSSKTTT